LHEKNDVQPARILHNYGVKQKRGLRGISARSAKRVSLGKGMMLQHALKLKQLRYGSPAMPLHLR